MATRPESVFESNDTFFRNIHWQSLGALQKSNLELYLNAMPSFDVILSSLQAKGLFLDKKANGETINTFLQKYPNLVGANLQCSPVELLAQPLLAAKTPIDIASDEETYPEPFNDLKEEIDCYIAMLVDVLNNLLAQQPYDLERDKENVTEKEHALQAGKMALLLGMPIEDVLALLFHDIARPSIKDPKYGHEHHAKEGSEILSPLRLLSKDVQQPLPTDYAGQHAFAKYLLYTLCPPYQQLISETSKYTLGIQSADFAAQLGALPSLDSAELACEIYKIMFMRLIDDMSKVPTSEIRMKLGGKEPEYFDNPCNKDPQLIAKMVKRQLIKQLSATRESVDAMKEKLDVAIKLMLRAEPHSTNEDLYVKHRAVIDPLRSSAPSREL